MVAQIGAQIHVPWDWCRLIGNENGQSAQTPVLTIVLIGNENGRGTRTQP
jgi:hypothetical protein